MGGKIKQKQKLRDYKNRALQIVLYYWLTVFLMKM